MLKCYNLWQSIAVKPPTFVIIMAKIKTTYFCQSCGTQHNKWVGKCSNCGEWNTLVEEVIKKESKNDRLQLFTGNKDSKQSNQPVLLQDVGLQDYPRIPVPGKELTRVLGGGIVPVSYTHLDVYKRQRMNKSLVLEPALFKFPVPKLIEALL